MVLVVQHLWQTSEWVWSVGGMTIALKHRPSRIETWSITIFFIVNLTRVGLASNLSLRSSLTVGTPYMLPFSHLLAIRREENPVRCHWMVYYTYNTLNMFRALLCPSSGARDYSVLLPLMVCDALVAGCWRSGVGQQVMRSGLGMLLDASRATSLIPNA